ncbi:hypothetical protein JI739_15690 [Ramlibacter sp. AW1]|uniref:Methyltransferase domain-containing protein n=1 Tax=Ramlibacter aurantiacus TaxID=2801330 RepID=A0A937D885_9BURK|nr:hypothetical protein [Ramlibacter aurantiacus]MBL0421791.1 hypothetical protein [Ramlibacter aurantiacus]
MLNGRSHPNRFFRNFIHKPRAIGAVLPASPSLSRAVAAAAGAALDALAPAQAPCGVLELGAGTGALTENIRHMQPVLIERDARFSDLLRSRFPELEIRNECAVQALDNLRQPVGIVSSIPLLNNPEAAELVQALERCYLAGLVRYLVLYTYGAFDPLRGTAVSRGRRAEVVWQSLPPASVWVYR